MGQLIRTNNKQEYKIHWKSFASEELEVKERLHVDQFKPYLNYSRISFLHRMELAGQSVLVLKDINLLPALLQNEKHFATQYEVYLRHRTADLRSITDLL